MSEERTWLRWSFRTVGWALWVLPGFVLKRLLPLYAWAATRFADQPVTLAKIMIAVVLCMLVIGTLCQATAWGLKRNRSWARTTGTVASIGLLFGFPWLTVIGAMGLFYIRSLRPVKEVHISDPNLLRPRDSFPAWIVGVLSGILWVVGLAYLFRYAHTLGLPSYRTAYWWPMLILAELVVVTVHEFGHALQAWAVGFRFKAINIGPLTVKKRARGHSFHLDLTRLVGGGGYMSAVPTSERHIRVNQILVVFAGPFLSLTAGLALLVVFLNLPGSRWEESWQRIGIFTVLFVVDFIRNLIPVGYTDGSLLLHLLLWTPKGREFSSAWMAGKEHEEAAALQAQTNFEGEVEQRRRILEQALPHLAPNSLDLASRYQELGFAELRAKRPGAAIENLAKSLEIFRACPNAHPLLLANSWMGLHSAYRLDQRPDSAMGAYAEAVKAFEAAIGNLPPAAVPELRMAVARMHLDWRAYQAASDEVGLALEKLQRSAKTLLLHAKLLALQAECEFCLGCPERGHAAARQAQEMLRSPEIGDAEHAQAIAELGSIAVGYWMVGLVDEAVALLHEAIPLMERRDEVNRTARLKVTLAEILRKAGRLPEAMAALPPDRDLTPGLREALLSQRAQIQLRAGQMDAAIADLLEAWSLKKADPHASAAEVATAQGALAEALLDSSRFNEAEQLARSACDVLASASHPNAAGPLITLAIVCRERQPEKTSAFLEEALRLISDAPLLKVASRARFLEAEATRLERFGLALPAKQFRAVAETQWSALGRSSVAA